ncbi:nucleotidyltransferase domain-containing protein [Modestobacter sp. SYSU DS0875]
MRRHDPERDRWAPLTVAELTGLLAGADGRWWLSGGVALDLFLGEVTREHGDIDVSVARVDWPALAARLGRHLQLCPVQDGRIDEVGEVPLDGSIHSLWCRRDARGPWLLQVNLEPVDADTWIYRRDDRVRLPFADATWFVDGLRCVQPHVQLLFKAARPGGKDEADRCRVLPRLAREQRTWLADAIGTAHPTSPWATTG